MADSLADLSTSRCRTPSSSVPPAYSWPPLCKEEPIDEDSCASTISHGNVSTTGPSPHPQNNSYSPPPSSFFSVSGSASLSPAIKTEPESDLESDSLQQSFPEGDFAYSQNLLARPRLDANSTPTYVASLRREACDFLQRHAHVLKAADVQAILDIIEPYRVCGFCRKCYIDEEKPLPYSNQEVYMFLPNGPKTPPHQDRDSASSQPGRSDPSPPHE